MKSSRVGALSVLLVCFVVLTVLYGRAVIQNDGISYYALTVSLIRDGDLSLENQSRQFQDVRIVPVGAQGQTASLYSCGFAILYAPFVICSEKILSWIPAAASWRPYPQGLRFAFADAAGIFAGSILYGFLTVLAGVALLRRLYDVSWMGAVLLALAAQVGTCLAFYNFGCPSFSHAVDAFLVAAAFLLVVLPFSKRSQFTLLRSGLLGMVLALSVLLRNNNIVLPPVLLAGYAVLLRRSNLPLTRNLACLFAGALPVVALHVHFNMSQYGGAVATGYRLREDLTTGERISYFWKLMFHPVAGVFISSPIAFFATLGLILGAMKRRVEPILALCCVLVVLGSLSFVGFIFPGSSFGQRLLAHLYIFWVLGMHEFLHYMKRTGTVVLIACVLWTFVLFNLYFVGSADGTLRKNGLRIGYDAATIIESAAEARAASLKLDPDEGLFTFWLRSLSAYPYPTIQYFLLHPEALQGKK